MIPSWVSVGLGSSQLVRPLHLHGCTPVVSDLFTCETVKVNSMEVSAPGGPGRAPVLIFVHAARATGRSASLRIFSHI